MPDEDHDDEFDEYDPWDGEEDDEVEETPSSEPMNWPQAVTYIAFFVAVVLVWHDCVVH